jgi:hypothetical protein
MLETHLRKSEVGGPWVQLYCSARHRERERLTFVVVVVVVLIVRGGGLVFLCLYLQRSNKKVVFFFWEGGVHVGSDLME